MTRRRGTAYVGLRLILSLVLISIGRRMEGLGYYLVLMSLVISMCIGASISFEYRATFGAVIFHFSNDKKELIYEQLPSEALRIRDEVK